MAHLTKMAALISLMIISLFNGGLGNIDVDIITAPAVRDISAMFMGVTIDTAVMRDNWRTLNFTSEKVLTLAKGLQPSYLRLGGTRADYAIFNRTLNTVSRFVDFDFSMSVEEWDTINKFVAEVGWKFIFDFNSLLRRNGTWDPTNAIKLIKYTGQKGYQLAGCELGNEPDLYSRIGASVPPDVLAQDFLAFREVVYSTLHPPCLVIGPDTSSVNSSNYFEQFLKFGGGLHVDVATFHHYYMDNITSTLQQFHNVTVLDSLEPQIHEAVDLCSRYAPGKQCWLGETSSTYGEGSESYSNAYVAGFMWMDKLGLAALYGLQGVMRQSFYGGYYGLINPALNPNPDYWLTVLYKRLVGSPVLEIKYEGDPHIRLYAHCTNTESLMGYHKGSVTVYFMNLQNKTATLDINGGVQDVYLLSPGDEYGLLSSGVRLNGELVQLISDRELPPLSGIRHEGSLELPGYGLGFVVLPKALKRECL